MKKRTKRNSRGFTLIEVIVIIVFVAILGTLLVSYMSGGVVKSSLPVVWVKQEYNIFETMEKISVDYQNALSSTFSLGDFATNKVAPYAGGGMTVTTDYINIDRTTGDLDASDSTNGLILRVKLQKGEPTVTAFFTR